MKNDLINRSAAIEAIEKHIRTAEEPYQLTDVDKVMNHAFEIAASCVYNLSATEANVPDINDGDMISRQAAIDAQNSLINRFEQILRDIRETKVDDSVCGMCEYDGAYIGQSGDWCNECPGFEKDDCFKLSEACRKRWLESVGLPSAQPEKRTKKRTEKHACDLISRQALCEYALNQKDKNITANDIMRFPSAQPERQKGEWIDYTEDGYVECPFCHNATNCDGNKDELHFCFSCGADMREDEQG